MQGQSSAVGSLTGSLNFDQGSTPNETEIDQQIYWNNVRNSAPDRLSEYVPSSNTGSTYVNSIVPDRRNLRPWSMDEPGSSVIRNQLSHNEQKAEHLWVSTTRACPSGHDLGNRRHESANGLSINSVNLSSNQIANSPLFMQSSSSTSISQDLNINAGSEGQGVDDCQIVERPLVFRSGSENLPRPDHSSPGSFDLQSSEHAKGSDGGPSSLMEGRRLSRKRKAIEENVGQSSGSGSSNYLQHESSAWRTIPAPRNTRNSLTLSAPSENTAVVTQPEQVNPRLGLGVLSASSESSPTISVMGNAEISRRNLRLRINSSQQQDSLPSNVFTGGTAFESSSISAPRQGSRLLPRSNSSSPEDATPRFQSRLAHLPLTRRNLQSSRWTRSSSSRAGSTLNPVIEGDAASPGESSSRIMIRNRLEHLIFRAPSRVRDSVQSPNDLSASGGIGSVAANAASSSQGGSAAGSLQGSGNNWFPDRNSSRRPERVSELIRRSLLSASGSVDHNINISPPHSHISDSDQEMPLPSEGQERHSSQSSSATLLDRHLDEALGLSYSLRTLAAASEGRSRLVSEIHDVLDLMRRGEGLRFEDVMILDHSVFFGMGDHHDRHRDMRLDVDNMSYEELLALEERIGNVNAGVSEETISSRLKQRKYTVSATTDLQEPEPCCICQDEYKSGDELGELECGHGFHAECIKQWLTRKNLCPICKTTAVDSKENAE